MKKELEFFYLCRLYNSPFVKKILGNYVGGTYTDFERVCGVNPKNKPFRIWIKNLGILKVIPTSDKYERYIIIEKTLLNIISKHELYQKDVRKPAYAEYEGILRH